MSTARSGCEPPPVWRGLPLKASLGAWCLIGGVAMAEPGADVEAPRGKVELRLVAGTPLLEAVKQLSAALDLPVIGWLPHEPAALPTELAFSGAATELLDRFAALLGAAWVTDEAGRVVLVRLDCPPQRRERTARVARWWWSLPADQRAALAAARPLSVARLDASGQDALAAIAEATAIPAGAELVLSYHLDLGFYDPPEPGGRRQLPRFLLRAEPHLALLGLPLPGTVPPPAEEFAPRPMPTGRDEAGVTFGGNVDKTVHLAAGAPVTLDALLAACREQVQPEVRGHASVLAETLWLGGRAEWPVSELWRTVQQALQLRARIVDDLIFFVPRSVVRPQEYPVHDTVDDLWWTAQLLGERIHAADLAAGGVPWSPAGVRRLRRAPLSHWSPAQAAWILEAAVPRGRHSNGLLGALRQTLLTEPDRLAVRLVPRFSLWIMGPVAAAGSAEVCLDLAPTEADRPWEPKVVPGGPAPARERAETVLRAALAGTDGASRARCVAAAGRSRDRAMILPLLPLAGAASAGAVVEALAQLGWHGPGAPPLGLSPGAAGPGALQAVASAAPAAKLATLRRLSPGDEGTRTILAAWRDGDSSPLVRAAAAGNYIRLGTNLRPADIATLNPFLGATDADVRAAALAPLVELLEAQSFRWDGWFPACRPRLMRLTDDPDGRVRELAYAGLGALRLQAVAVDLLARLDELPPGDKVPAAAAVLRLLEDSGGYPCHTDWMTVELGEVWAASLAARDQPGEPLVLPEHFVLGILNTPDSQAYQLLVALDVPIDDLRFATRAALAKAHRHPAVIRDVATVHTDVGDAQWSAPGYWVLSEEASAVWRAAVVASQAKLAGDIHSGHLLLALAEHVSAVHENLMGRFEVTAEAVRDCLPSVTEKGGP